MRLRAVAVINPVVVEGVVAIGMIIVVGMRGERQIGPPIHDEIVSLSE